MNVIENTKKHKGQIKTQAILVLFLQIFDMDIILGWSFFHLIIQSIMKVKATPIKK